MEPCFLVSLDLDSFLLLDPDPDPYGYHNKDLYQSAFQSLILNINVLMFSWVFIQIINKPAREGSEAPQKMRQNPFWILKTVFRLWLRSPGGDITWTIILLIPWYRSKVNIPFVYPGSATLQKQDVTTNWLVFFQTLIRSEKIAWNKVTLFWHEYQAVSEPDPKLDTKYIGQKKSDIPAKIN